MDLIPYDKLELSPNSRAHCRSCGIIIRKNCVRIGKQEIYSHFPYKKYTTQYYHKQCMPQLVPNLHLEPRYNKRKYDVTWPETEAIRKQQVMFRRFDLRRRIREWRRVLAESQNREAYWIFDDATLDDVVDKLPSTKHELLECYGMGPRRVNLYGSFILGAIQKYKQDPNNARWINELGILHKSNDWDGLQVMKNNSNEGDDFVKHEQLPLLTLSSPQKLFNSINKQKAEETDSKPHAVAIKEEYDAAAVAILKKNLIQRQQQ